MKIFIFVAVLFYSCATEKPVQKPHKIGLVIHEH
jgi:hypothetical protein